MGGETIEHRGSVRLRVTPVNDNQVFVTAAVVHRTSPAQEAAEVYRCAADLLAETGKTIVHERVFGSLPACEAILAARGEQLAATGIDPGGAVTYVQGGPVAGAGLAGVNLMAVRSDGVRQIRDEAGMQCGRSWQMHGAQFILIQNMNGLAQPDGPSAVVQAGRMFDRAARLLRAQQVDYRSVARTWLYLHGILGWYGEFNAVRNAKYEDFGLMPDPAGTNGKPIVLPASTGIEGLTPARAAVAMDLLAARVSPDARVEIHQMTNRRQIDAFKYGSAFSRGAAIRMPEATWISLSGTAAIDETGVTMHVGDFSAQMNATLDAVEALISQEGASLADLCDATCFIKRAEDAETYRRILAERGLADMPAVAVLADVCRPDLLFEIDGAAVTRKT